MIVIQNPLSYPNYPRIAYQNFVSSATLTASSAATGFAANNLKNPLTWNFWRPSSVTATMEFNLGAVRTVDYCGIAAHNCGTKGNTITLEYWDGDSWVTIDTHVPTDDSVILFLFDPILAQVFRLSISGGTAPTISTVYMGQALVSQRSMYVGHTPITLNQKHVVRPQRSEGGQWLGRSVIRQAAQANIALKHLTAAWVRTYLEPFIESAVNYPFFFAWRPTEFPAEVGYCWTGDDIVPQNTGPRDLMSVAFTVDGIIE